MRTPYKPGFLYVEHEARADPLARAVIASLPDAEVIEISDHRRLEAEPVPLRGYDARVKQAVLVLARLPGPFIRPFPGTSRTGDRAAFLIAHAQGCPYDCSYCFLQSYFEHGAPVLFTNQGDLLAELGSHLEAHPRDLAVGYQAGELCDAMALEALSGFAAAVVPLFRNRPNAQLELRTKCDEVAEHLPTSPPANVTVSWTLTPRQAWRLYEAGTPEPSLRLAAARACQEMGYRVGIRLDPALLLPDWEQAYRELIAEIFAHLIPSRVESFVLGGFRCTPALANRVRSRFPSCGLLRPESVLCEDRKYRYFRPLRVRLYRGILQSILAHDPGATVRLCMETEEVHREVWPDREAAIGSRAFP